MGQDWTVKTFSSNGPIHVVIQTNEELMDSSLASIQESGFPAVTILWSKRGINEYHAPREKNCTNRGAWIGILIKDPRFYFLHFCSSNSSNLVARRRLFILPKVG
jgi:hypothetical protein